MQALQSQSDFIREANQLCASSGIPLKDAYTEISRRWVEAGTKRERLRKALEGRPEAG